MSGLNATICELNKTLSVSFLPPITACHSPRTSVALTMPRCFVGGETGDLHLRSPIGASAKRTPLKYVIPVDAFAKPLNVPSRA